MLCKCIQSSILFVDFYRRIVKALLQTGFTTEFDIQIKKESLLKEYNKKDYLPGHNVLQNMRNNVTFHL